MATGSAKRASQVIAGRVRRGMIGVSISPNSRASWCVIFSPKRAASTVRGRLARSRMCVSPARRSA